MPIRQIDPSELHHALAGPAELRPVLVDVRTAQEHELVALPGSLLAPLQELEAHRAELEALKGKRVVVYCHHGVRSLHGAAFLASLGIDAESLKGGIDQYALEVDAKLARY